MFSEFPKVSVEGVGRDLTDVSGGWKYRRVYKVCPPGPGEEVFLFSLGWIVQNCWEVH